MLGYYIDFQPLHSSCWCLSVIHSKWCCSWMCLPNVSWYLFYRPCISQLLPLCTVMLLNADNQLCLIISFCFEVRSLLALTDILNCDSLELCFKNVCTQQSFYLSDLCLPCLSTNLCIWIMGFVFFLKPCAMVVPDIELTYEIMLVAAGFIDVSLLARSLLPCVLSAGNCCLNRWGFLRFLFFYMLIYTFTCKQCRRTSYNNYGGGFCLLNVQSCVFILKTLEIMYPSYFIIRYIGYHPLYIIRYKF